MGGSILNEAERLAIDNVQKDNDIEGVSISHWQHSLSGSEKYHRRRHLSKLRAGTKFCASAGDTIIHFKKFLTRI